MTDDEPWRITHARRRYETVAMAAQRCGKSPQTMKRIIERAGLKADEHLNGHTPLYLVARIDRMLANRPGKGARGVARKVPAAR